MTILDRSCSVEPALKEALTESYRIFQNEMEAGKRTALIKKEYGLGGASWPVDGMGLHGYDTYGSQGIRFQWRDEQGEAEGTLSWSSVEQEIGTLILNR